MEEYTIPKHHYKKIEANSTSLKIPTTYDIIIYKFDHEFLIKHKKRRNLDTNSTERLRIEKENRQFLEKYYKVCELITYWYGYYLYQGIGGPEDKDKASELYKEAADEGIAGAQLRYAFSLIKNNTINDIQTFITYLNQSAENGNSIAQYNLGDIYFFGKLNMPIDKEKGKRLLISAAKNKNTKAIELCKKENINLDQINWDDSVTSRNSLIGQSK
ncbi:6884_t:CDS:1 [Gigaspora margarita]|uniref:6884_t:CDS:1 n=1 Tax=Gigaspora margarita TaxID=4874 RepID=A0ABM8VY13_GIGMA|nr:6884_t:CDS:1 [Gigaspora margarita]